MKSPLKSSVFAQGLLFALPIFLTISITIWLLRSLESILAPPIKFLVPNVIEFPGMGIVAAICLIYIIGLAIRGRVAGTLLKQLKRLLQRIPVANVVYDNINEMVSFVSGEKDEDLERVVLVSIQEGLNVMGFVTQDESDLQSDQDDPLRAIYLPMSYQMGGYLVYAEESKLTDLNISKKEAMQRILTADIRKSNKHATDSESQDSDE